MNKKTIVSILLCILISSIMISPIAVAGDTTNPNNWSTSDVRTFLNGIDNSSGYASYFTDAEYGVILPKTIGTNGSTSNDRFYLPGYVNAHVISWKTEEVNISSVNENISYIIPKAYWAEVSGSGGNWLRSAQENSSDGVFIYGNTDIVQVMTVDATVRGIAPLFHINMEKVIFASSASAADLLDLNGSGNANSENIPGWENFGKATTGNMPVYGMYLKTEDTNKNFKVNSVEYSNGKLNLQYENADVGKAIVIQMYSVDSLSTGCTFYGAASKIKNASGTCTIDFSNSGTPSFDNLVMQVWMENPGTGVSMAPATEPQSFSFIDGRFTETTPSIKNLRVFAMKDELACSWGDYTADGYDASQIITGGINSGNYYGFDLNISGTQMGPYATNQKIYFGTDTDGKPLVHWIAGRENTTGSMCLYQARVVDKRTFKGGSIHEQQGFSFANGINTDTVLSCSNLVSSNIVVSTSGGNGDGAITYQSSNPYVASVNEISGVVTIKNPGTFEILATKKNSSGYYDVTTRSGKIVVEDHSYSQFQDESGTHLKKCTQENCNSIVSHTPNYVVDGDVHKCSYDNCTITHDVEWEETTGDVHKCSHENCTITHDVEWEETTGDVHKCSYENCDITHDIEWEESTAGVHKCSHDNCAITHDIEWEESTAGVHKCSHENCTITHDIEWEESTGDVHKCSHENCTITHDIEWEEATGDVHKCSHENCTITHDIEWEESTGDVHKCSHDNCAITHDIEWEESTGGVHKCSHENCNITHDIEWEEATGDVHKCSHENCTITHDIEWEESTGDVHKCGHDNCDITHDIEWEESTGDVHKCSHENCTITHDVEWEKVDGNVHKCSYENCTISHNIEWEKKDEDVHVCKTCNMAENHAGEAATCNKVAVCSVCNSEYGTVDTSNHEYDLTTWKCDATHHWHVCAVHEDAVLEKVPHTWGQWIMLESTNEAGEGLKTRSCTVCGATETDVIIVSPETGIQENFVYILSAVIVVCGVVILMGYTKRNILKK